MKAEELIENVFRPCRKSLEELTKRLDDEPAYRYPSGRLENFKVRQAIILAASAIVEALDARQ